MNRNSCKEDQFAFGPSLGPWLSKTSDITEWIPNGLIIVFRHANGKSYTLNLNVGVLVPFRLEAFKGFCVKGLHGLVCQHLGTVQANAALEMLLIQTPITLKLKLYRN